jgi:hypothetical protein
MKAVRGWNLMALCAVLLVAPAAAQDGASTPRHGCFTGRPLPECAGFWIFELRGQLPFVNTTRVYESIYYDSIQGSQSDRRDVREFGNSLGWELGYLWNLNERWAAGATLGIEFGHPAYHYAARARVRRWVGEGGVSLEATPGLFTSDAYSTSGSLLGFTVDLRVNIQDQGYLGARYDLLSSPRSEREYGYDSQVNTEPVFVDVTDIDPGGTHHAFYLTVGLGSKPALWGSGALVVGVLALLGIFAAGGGLS